MSTTLLFSKLDEVRERFPEYVAELQVLFEQYGLQSGSPDAVVGLAEAVSTQNAFRDDVVSLLDVISARESQISYLELLGMLLVASGEAATAEGPEMEEPVRRTLNFLLEVRRSQKNRAEVGSESTPALAGGEIAPEPARAARLQAEPVVKAPGREAEAPRAFSLNNVTRTERMEAVPGVAATHAGRRWAWLIAACAVVGVLLGLFYPRASAPSQAQWVAANGSAVVNPVIPPEPVSEAGATPDVESRDGLGVDARVASHRAEDAAAAVVVKTSNAGKRAAPVGAKSRAAARPDARVSTAAVGTNVVGMRVNPLARVAPGAMALAAPKPVYLEGGALSPVVRGGRPRVISGSSGIMAANLVSSPAPTYPAQASAAQVQGEVVIAAVVGKDGSIIDTRVVSGPPLLREAALNAVQRWRYRPYEVDGRPSEIATEARLDFRLGAN